MNKNPIFKPIFGSSWEQLASVLKKRYSNKSHSNDSIRLEGILDIFVSKWMRFLGPTLRLCGALVPYSEKKTPVTVTIKSTINSNIIKFNRTFYFKHKKPYIFNSTLSPKDNKNVIEYMRYGLGWKMACLYDGNKVILEDHGYVLKILNFLMPLPLHLILGRVDASEKSLSNNEFSMKLTMTHPLFGKTLEYQGIFKISEISS